MEEIQEKKQRGGARQGAGRKKTRGGTLAIRTTIEAAEILSKVESKTDFVNEAIIFYTQSKGML